MTSATENDGTAPSPTTRDSPIAYDTYHDDPTLANAMAFLQALREAQFDPVLAEYMGVQ